MLVRFISKLQKLLVPGQNQRFIIPIRNNSNSPVVTIEDGKLKGSIKKLLDGTKYYSFKGIPYAQPPVGNLRFKAPLPLLPWKDVYDATRHGPVCPQMDMITAQVLEGDENCLYLNVYSKYLSNENKPVIVFIHGGAFMSGSGNSDLYGPEYLVQHDVVLVTINYRLEVLGFLCLDTEDVPGNAGLKDQVAALKWVKNNISNFGGDPNNVTLMGESAGGASVTYHMASPMSKHLFHKAIVQSGVCLSDWAKAEEIIERAFKVGKLLGKETNNMDELTHFLRSVPAVQLAKVTFSTLTEEEKIRGLPMQFCPVVEKKFPNVEPFLTEDSLNLLLENKVANIPMIIGYNTAEGLVSTSFFIKKIDIYNKEMEYKVQREVVQRISKEKLKEFGDRLKQFYFNGKDLTEDMILGMSALESDIHFVYNINRYAHLYSAITKAPVFMYNFGFESELNIMKTVTGMTDFKGACHADDLFYLYSSKMTKDLLLENPKLMEKVDIITKLWTNFAKTGNPTPDSSMGFEWKPFTSKSKHFLNIETPVSMQQNPNKENVKFWNKIYTEAGLPCIVQSNL